MEISFKVFDATIFFDICENVKHTAFDVITLFSKYSFSQYNFYTIKNYLQGIAHGKIQL